MSEWGEGGDNYGWVGSIAILKTVVLSRKI